MRENKKLATSTKIMRPSSSRSHRKASEGRSSGPRPIDLISGGARGQIELGSGLTSCTEYGGEGDGKPRRSASTLRFWATRQ